jgi:signal peptidase I
MSTRAVIAGTSPQQISRMWPHLPSVPEALASFLRTIVVALFLLTFVMQPFLIPSESMERTLLVGDFLLVDKQIFAPAGKGLLHWVMPYREIERGDVVVFHHADPPYLVKRVIGMAGDHIRIENGRVIVNGIAIDEPYVALEPAALNPFRDNFPGNIYTDPNIDPIWWKELQSLTKHGELVVPQGEYFVLGDNRNHSKDSRFWGFVPRDAIVAQPLLIYFSLRRPSTTDVQRASDDRLGQGRESAPRLTRFARWNRIFQVVH